MCNSIISARSESPQAPIVPLPGHEYEISGDGADWHNGRLLRGILVAASGRAYAGLLDRDAAGEFVSIAMDEDGMIAAPDGWQAYIEREIAGVPAPADRAVAA
jgi:hypothetical protein